GPDSNVPQSTIQNLYQATENLSWLHGNHNFKFGVEGRKFISPQTFTQRVRGDYDYNSITTYLVDQNPDNLAERSNGNPVSYATQAGVNWYVNDTWHLRPNLTADLGVRYEYMTVPIGERTQALNSAASVPGLINFAAPQSPKHDFMPRIGLAWTPGTS